MKDVLDVFNSDDEKFNSVLLDKDIEYNDDLAKEKSITKSIRGARLRYGDLCGFAASGRKVYIINPSNNSGVNVTVRVSYRSWDYMDSGSYDKRFYIPSKSERHIGCTRGGMISSHSYSFEIIKCEK